MKNLIILIQFLLNTLLMLYLVRYGRFGKRGRGMLGGIKGALSRLSARKSRSQGSETEREPVSVAMQTRERLERELLPYEVLRREKKKTDRRVMAAISRRGNDWDRLPARFGISKGEAELIRNIDKLKGGLVEGGI